MEERRIPAGWYPDPAGLPQLRWWDNHQWTEHTSDAREPLVAGETVDPAREAFAAKVASVSPAPELVDEPETVVVTRSTQSIESMVEQALAPAVAEAAAAHSAPIVIDEPALEPQLVGVGLGAAAAPRAAVDLGARLDAQLSDAAGAGARETITRPEPVFVNIAPASAIDEETFGTTLRRLFRSAR